MLDLLPGEILIIIIQKLSKPDLSRLSLSLKYFHQTVQPEIYRDFTITTNHEKHHDVHGSRFLRPALADGSSSVQPLGVYTWIRHLTIEAPLHRHENIAKLWGMALSDENFATRRILEHMEFTDLHRNVRGILARLPINSLQSFSWHLGCCLPSGLFSAHGYLARRQRQLTSLSVKVYPGYAYTDGLDGLLLLRNLRHFAWQEADFIDSYLFYDVIEANCHHLESLDLGFQPRLMLAPRALDYTLRSSGLFSNVPNDPDIYFGSLRSISLQHVSFKLAYTSLYPTFDFSQIRKLKLRNCRCVLHLLRALRLTTRTINLKALECDYEELGPPVSHGESIYDAGVMVMEVPKFLEAFYGLEQLYVRAMDLVVQSAERTPWAIIQHARTLKRLTYHYHDKLAMGPNQDSSFIWTHRLNQVLDQLRLEALGLNIVLCDLRPGISGTQTAQTLKLLHLRITAPYHRPRNLLHKLKTAGLPKQCVPPSFRRPKRRHMPNDYAFPIHRALRLTLDQTQRRMRKPLNMMELLNFVKWAFGPDGLPNLLLLAYGDFSCGERYRWSRVVFVRYPRPNVPIPSAQEDKDGVFGPALPFRVMHPEDEYLWDEIEGAREFLEACPQYCPEDERASYQNGYGQESYFSDDELPGPEAGDEEDYLEEFEEDFF